MVAEPHTHLRGFCQHTVEICGRHAACWQYRAATKTQQATADRVTMSGLPLIEDTAFQPTVHARQPHKQQMPTSTCNAPLKAGHCLQNPHLQSLTVMCAADAVPPSTLSHPFARQPSVHAQSSEGCSAVQCSAVQCSAVQCSAVQCPAVHTAGKVYCINNQGATFRAQTTSLQDPHCDADRAWPRNTLAAITQPHATVLSSRIFGNIPCAQAQTQRAYVSTTNPHV
jgi:hypothetical protein